MKHYRHWSTVFLVCVEGARNLLDWKNGWVKNLRHFLVRVRKSAATRRCGVLFCLWQLSRKFRHERLRRWIGGVISSRLLLTTIDPLWIRYELHERWIYREALQVSVFWESNVTTWCNFFIYEKIVHLLTLQPFKAVFLLDFICSYYFLNFCFCELHLNQTPTRHSYSLAVHSLVTPCHFQRRKASLHSAPLLPTKHRWRVKLTPKELRFKSQRTQKVAVP